MNPRLRILLFRVLPGIAVVLLSFFAGEYVQHRQQAVTPAPAKSVSKVTAPNPNLAIVSGTVKSKSGDSFLMVLSNGKSSFIGTTSATVIQQENTLTLNDLAVGQKILVTGTYINQTDIKATDVVLSTAK
jgi:hypothetical protein